MEAVPEAVGVNVLLRKWVWRSRPRMSLLWGKKEEEEAGALWGQAQTEAEMRGAETRGMLGRGRRRELQGGSGGGSPASLHLQV